MSGIVSGIDYSVLFSTNSGGASAASILSIASGATAVSSSLTSAVSTGNPLTDLQLAQANETKDVALEAKDPTVVRDLANFTKAVGAAKDLTTALTNPNVLKVLLTANGLGDQVQYPALAAKVLQSDPSDPNSLVNKLGDTRWKSVVQTYNFAANGLSALSNPATQSTLSQSYERVQWLNSLDRATPGLAQALQFKQQASQITNVDQILGDPTNWEVVLTGLGIPQQIAFQDTSAQEQAVSSRLDISKLQDPRFVTALTDQYLLAKQQQNGGANANASGILV